MTSRSLQLVALAAFIFISGCSRAQINTASSTPSTVAPSSSPRTGATRVLLITGDWKSQAWYQDKWNQDKKLMRGRYLASQVEKAAPQKFEFTELTSYEGLQYVDAGYLSQFDVLLMGDVMGFSLPPRFMNGLQTFLANGGGFGYLASWKWHTAMMDGSALEKVLPARFGIDNTQEDWSLFNHREQVKPFNAQPSLPNQPVVTGLNWSNGPKLDGVFKMFVKDGAQVLLKTPEGKPVLAVWETGGGRAALSASIFSNDELSGGFAQNWTDFGRYNVQLLSWLGARSKARPVTPKPTTGDVLVNVDATKLLNTVSAKQFSIHAAHDDPGLAPLQGKALESFNALNLDGGFSRVLERNFEPKNDNDDPNSFNWAAFNFHEIDQHLAEVRRLKLEPILLVTGFRYGQPGWLHEGGASIINPTDKYIAEVAEQCAALVEHINCGKGNSPNYKLNLKYLEIGNEPDINSKTVDAYVKILRACAARIHRDYPGVRVGAMGNYEIPALYWFMEKGGDDVDWISRHPYGWTGEMLFQKQDEFAAWRRAKGLKPVEFIVTEWDFWIQGKPKFDYMMLRNFEAVRRADLAGALHYRLGQYDEGGYLFGVLWAGWGKERGAKDKGDPMHDAYDAFWAFRDFRGNRVATQTSSSNAKGLADHLHADATRDGERMNVVLYFDRGYDGTGWKDFSRGVHYNKVRVDLRVALPPSKSTRTLTLSRATGEGFSELPEKVTVAANATSFSRVVEIEPNTAVSLSLR